MFSVVDSSQFFDFTNTVTTTLIVDAIGSGDLIQNYAGLGGGGGGGGGDVGNGTKKGKLKDCFADLKFRPVGPPAPDGATHSFWYVQGSTGSPSIVSAGPSNPNGTGQLNVWVNSGTQSSRFGPDNPSATTQWSTGSSPKNCDAVDKLLNAANNFPNGLTTYNFLGPNSNSAARELGSVAGFSPTAPPGSVGWNVPLSPH